MEKDNCPLCDLLEREKEYFLYEDDDVVVVQTKKMKGHKKRIMVVSKKHISQELRGNDIKFFDKLKNNFIYFCKGYFNDEPTFCLNEPTYASYPEHWHLIASDWWGEDLMQVCYTPHQSIKTYKEWKPER